VRGVACEAFAVERPEQYRIHPWSPVAVA
jgi:hypothetical protein